MKLLTIFFTLSATIAILAATSLADFYEEQTSLRGLSRFLAQQNLKAKATCDKFPRICRLRNSPGPDCCKKRCVNVKTDRMNCGMCGYKCKYGEICCKGQCVNASFDKRDCGGCYKKCKRDEFCVYGMCNYA
ncbi:stigma-specific STIG1-like protein 3 [Herrania umbratica]|uniref:Stigma-specific STIG1-like protein 3 n=1 Tax=Herrania umbratica TaxID=108875 RepID=A0A6J1B555_9ROSI|nr:stigma-specific STIG1-like protein 3 [Herrania umbratica]